MLLPQAATHMIHTRTDTHTRRNFLEYHPNGGNKKKKETRFSVFIYHSFITAHTLQSSSTTHFFIAGNNAQGSSQTKKATTRPCNQLDSAHPQKLQLPSTCSLLSAESLTVMTLQSNSNKQKDLFYSYLVSKSHKKSRRGMKDM